MSLQSNNLYTHKFLRHENFKYSTLPILNDEPTIFSTQNEHNKKIADALFDFTNSRTSYMLGNIITIKQEANHITN